MVVQRDNERFKRLYPEKRAVMPKDYAADLEFKPIRIQIREQLVEAMKESLNNNYIR